MVLCFCLKRSPRVHEPRNATWHWRCIKRAGGFAYAESRDGLSWDKPNLGRTEWPAGSGDTANNLLSTFGFGSTGGCGTGIVLDVSSGAIGPVQGSSGAVATMQLVWRSHAKSPTTRAGRALDIALRLE